MQYLAYLLVFIICSVTAYGQEPETSSEEGNNTITVVIDKIKNNKGNILIALHDESTFMKSEGLQHGQYKIENGKVVVSFNNIPQGEYAIMVLHDENENNRMDYDENMMPKEDYGMSNNDMSFGPPQFANAKFILDNEDLELNIRL